MDILITGGNGFLGHNLVTALRARGDRVRVIALPTEDTNWLEEQGVEVFRGDIRDPAILTAPMSGVEGVIHLAAMIGAWRPLHEYYAVNVTGTENVCRAALAMGVKRLVHISSAMVYNLAIGRPVTEEDPLAPLDEPYCTTKAAGDALVRRLIANEGLPAVVIRPGTLFGPGDRLNFGRIADRLKAGKMIVIGTGNNAVPFVYVTDMVHGLMLALDHPRAVGQVYNIGADQPLTQEALLNTIAREIGAPPPRIHVPYYPLYAAASAAERIARLSGDRIHPPVTRHGVKLYGADNLLSIEKARRELGYAPNVSLREGIRLTAAWYVAQHAAPLDAASRVRGGGRPLAGTAPTQRALAGEVAIVTGASSGIGAATARELARRGARVVLAARRGDELDRQVRAIAAAGGQALAVPTDVGDAAQVMRLVERAREAFGRVDVLVNNAGASWTKPLAATSADDIARLLRVNLRGAMLVTRAVLPEMLARHHGAIVSVGSIQSRVAVEPLYSATKYGVRGFSLALRRQIAGSGVSVSLVEPGNIDTAMTSALRERMPGPELVASAIADLIVHPRREVIVPFKYHAIVWLDQLLPGVMDVAYQWRHRHDPARGAGRNPPAYVAERYPDDQRQTAEGMSPARH